VIVLPFPSSALSGHNNGNPHAKAGIVRKHREQAKLATLAAKPTVPEQGDITVTVRFVPPNNRGDRINYPNRCKPIFDGIADALGVNDKRFVPMFIFAQPEAPGRVEVWLSA
jgi:crossover junction endodeoxyribonuclease RusA